jgi:hypothetical protein
MDTAINNTPPPSDQQPPIEGESMDTPPPSDQQPPIEGESMDTSSPSDQQPPIEEESMDTPPPSDQQPSTEGESMDTAINNIPPPSDKEETTNSEMSTETLPENSEEPISSTEGEDTNDKLRQNCDKIESSLDSIYIGLVLEEIQGKQTVFAFLNYDLLEKMVKIPGNFSYGYIFCRNENTQIYPIEDSNSNTTIKWATVDELIFEKKVVEEPVDSIIAEMFANNDNLWNIEDSENCYIDFPFVVYGVQIDETTNKFKTVMVREEHWGIEKYGTPTSEEDDGIADEYRERYCFTLRPVSFSEHSPLEDNNIISPPPDNSAEITDQNSETETVQPPPDNSAEITEQNPETETVQPPPDNPAEIKTDNPKNNTTPLIQGGDDQPNLESDVSQKPRRYAMFAWKTRYVVTDAQVDELISHGGNPSTENPPSSSFDAPLNNSGLVAKSLENTEDTVYTDEEKDIIILEKAQFPTIYTITKSKYTDNKPIVTWGVLNSSQFTGL